MAGQLPVAASGAGKPLATVGQQAGGVASSWQPLPGRVSERSALLMPMPGRREGAGEGGKVLECGSRTAWELRLGLSAPVCVPCMLLAWFPAI